MAGRRAPLALADRQAAPHAVAPWQLEPSPAVQPKQWHAVATRAPGSPASEARSKTVRAPDGSGRSSCWLKSQSYSLGAR